MNNTQRSMRGLQSKREGEYFENLIEASLEWYRIRGEAEIQKTPEPMKPLGKANSRGQFLACFTKAAQPDFKGTLYGGRSVVFEAKHTTSDRIEYKAVTEEQGKRLEQHERLGAEAFVLVAFGLQDFYRIPWEVWRSMKEIFGYKHIKQTQLEPFRVQYIAGVIKLLDGFVNSEAMKEEQGSIEDMVLELIKDNPLRMGEINALLRKRGQEIDQDDLEYMLTKAHIDGIVKWKMEHSELLGRHCIYFWTEGTPPKK